MLAEQTGQNSKKLKANIEPESKSADSVPIVIISEALANFFGTSEREMSQAEVLRQVWEYIKVNQLEVGNQINDIGNFIVSKFVFKWLYIFLFSFSNI